MKYSIEAANEYIKENISTVNGKYRLSYHMMPPVGWMNDPNGLSLYKGQYHLFYQFYPYKAEWGPMHWGHFISDDLITYQDAPVALAPDDEKVVSGCFSGGALVEGDTISLIYTNHFEKPSTSCFSKKKIRSQKVCQAVSTDGISFKNSFDPIFDNESLPEYFSREDFRDPCPAKVGKDTYIFVGGKDKKKDQGVIAVLKRDKNGVYRYAFSIGPYYELGNMAECPSYTKIGDKDVILVSGCAVKRKKNSFKNVNSSVFLVGKIDFEKGNMVLESAREIDKGECFYAPQCVAGREDVFIAWYEMWGRPYPTNKMGHNWVGAFTIPRKLSIKNNEVCQEPIDELKKYYKESYEYHLGDIPKVSDVTIKYDSPFKIKFKATNGSFTIGCKDGRIYLDTKKARNGKGSVRKTDGYYYKGQIRILFDVSGVEIFVCDGEETITSRIYLDGNYEPDIKGKVSIEVKTFNFGE